jgi:hypothetical protein
MPQINYWINNHKLPAIMQYAARAYAPKQYEKDPWRVEQVKSAMNWIQTAVVEGKKCSESCDEAFGKLPGGRKFSDLWADQAIHISFHTSPDPKLFGQAKLNGKDLAVSYGSFKQGWKMVAATIIHEMAHLNGAPDDTKDAEKTLLHCGLKSMHRKDIIGYLKAIPNNAIQFA